MKKKLLIQTILIALLMLIVGFVAGMLVAGFPPDTSLLTGTIGKVDRYHNVRITEDDILLRNELLEDTDKRDAYKNYLNYYYIRSMRTSLHLDQAVGAARSVPEFMGTYSDYAEDLSNFRQYLDHARTDILKALDIIIHLDAQPRVPVIEYLNQANHVIARLRQYDNNMVDFMIAIETFLQLQPGIDHGGLSDAHDILALALVESALLTQNKPLLKFLDKHTLANDTEGVKELVSNLARLDSHFNNQLTLDAEALELKHEDHLGLVYSDAGKLATGFTNDAHLATTLMSENMVQVVLDTETLEAGWDSERLGVFFSMENLGIIIFLDTEGLKRIF